MRCRNFCWLSSLLLWACAATAKPPVLDSTFVFEAVNGVFGQMTELPGGDVLVTGRFGEDSSRRWELGRMNAAREFVWTRDIYATDSGEVYVAYVNGDRALVSASERVYLNEHSWTYRRNYLCYSLNGDSLWANSLADSVNYTNMGDAIGTDDGGFLVYGQESYIDSNYIYYQAKLVKLDQNGVVSWERFFDGDNYSSGDILELSSDSVLVVTLDFLTEGTDIRFFFLDMSGNIGRTLRYQSVDQNTGMIGATLLSSEHGYDLIWSSETNANLGTTLQLLRLDSTGAVRLITSAEESVNRFQTFYPVESGLLTFGLPDYLMPSGLFVGHMGANHVWYYMEQFPSDVSTSAYSMLPGAAPTVLGALHVDIPTWHPAIFYFSPEGPASYIYTAPGRLDYGIVPLEETREIAFELALTGESPVTVTEFLSPQDYAISAQVPLTIMPDEPATVRLAFRPEERRHFVDTLWIVSSALNEMIFLPITGEAPYPLCEPHTHDLDLRWCVIGDTVSAELRIDNPGTEPLHIDELAQPWPFWLEDVGPFVVPVDSFMLLTIYVAPTLVGIHNGFLEIHSDEPNTPDTIALSVRGVDSPINAGDTPQLPREFALHTPYPNPFNAVTTLEFDLPTTAQVSLELYDITGRRVREMLRGEFSAGTHVVNVAMPEASSGLYFAVLRARGETSVQKLMLIR